jgi:hypothetical protein
MFIPVPKTPVRTKSTLFLYEANSPKLKLENCSISLVLTFTVAGTSVSFVVSYQLKQLRLVAEDSPF